MKVDEKFDLYRLETKLMLGLLFNMAFFFLCWYSIIVTLYIFLRLCIYICYLKDTVVHKFSKMIGSLVCMDHIIRTYFVFLLDLSIVAFFDLTNVNSYSNVVNKSIAAGSIVTSALVICAIFGY